MTEIERAEFLADQHVAIMAVERPDAPPLAVPVWYRLDEAGNIAVWTEHGTLKERTVRTAGRFALAVQNENPPYGYVTVEGHSTVVDGVTRDDVRPIVERYMAADEVENHLDAAFNDRAILVVMTPTRWYTADFAKV
jgi:PPOX class probable F420-dependent enzyme